MPFKEMPFPATLRDIFLVFRSGQYLVLCDVLVSFSNFSNLFYLNAPVRSLWRYSVPPLLPCLFDLKASSQSIHFRILVSNRPVLLLCSLMWHGLSVVSAMYSVPASHPASLRDFSFNPQVALSSTWQAILDKPSSPWLKIIIYYVFWFQILSLYS